MSAHLSGRYQTSDQFVCMKKYVSNANICVYGIKLKLFLSPITYQYIIFMHISIYNIMENLHDLSVREHMYPISYKLINNNIYTYMIFKYIILYENNHLCKGI